MNDTASTSRVWDDQDPRLHFSELVDAAVEGRPQYVRRPDGREVVVVSRDDFEKRPSGLKNFLLRKGFAEDEDDAFDRAMREIDEEGSPFLVTGTAPRID